MEHLNPNIEIRNPKQIQIPKIQMYQTGGRCIVLHTSIVLVIGQFGFSICFVFRASDFEFIAQTKWQKPVRFRVRVITFMNRRLSI